MEQNEIDKLVNDIQEYLKEGEDAPVTADHAGDHAGIDEELSCGAFLAETSRQRIPLILKVGRFASYGVEVLTIALLTAIILHPPQTWPKTIMLLCGVLLFGIFAITTILSYQARIRLLLKIEGNTRAMAASKARIAESLERIHIG